MKFIDEAKIYIRSGSGGSGAVSFRREKFVPRGGPDGGDGGRGGNIVFITDSGLNTLLDFKYNRRYIAGNGKAGSGKCSTGADGEDCIIKVPVGTLIKDATSGEILFDLNTVNASTHVLCGGRGGKGNYFFRSPTNQTPKQSQKGEGGEEKDIILELKLMADVGLLGMPNVGKSTFISRVSAARPRVADYPFTTLVPNLGVVQGDYIHSFVIADIPGLIEGAHKGKGLGLKFLRHVERTRVLLHILDPTEKSAETIIHEYKVICNELLEYKSSLADKVQMIAINKIDLNLKEETKNKLKEFFSKDNKELFFISAVTGEGVKDLLHAMQRSLQ